MGEIGAGFLNILFGCGNGDILLLHNAICAGRLIQQYLVVLFAVFVQSVPAQGYRMESSKSALFILRLLTVIL